MLEITLSSDNDTPLSDKWLAHQDGLFREGASDSFEVVGSSSTTRLTGCYKAQKELQLLVQVKENGPNDSVTDVTLEIDSLGFILKVIIHKYNWKKEYYKEPCDVLYRETPEKEALFRMVAGKRLSSVADTLLFMDKSVYDLPCFAKAIYYKSLAQGNLASFQFTYRSADLAHNGTNRRSYQNMLHLLPLAEAMVQNPESPLLRRVVSSAGNEGHAIHFLYALTHGKVTTKRAATYGVGLIVEARGTVSLELVEVIMEYIGKQGLSSPRLLNMIVKSKHVGKFIKASSGEVREDLISKFSALNVSDIHGDTLQDLMLHDCFGIPEVVEKAREVLFFLITSWEDFPYFDGDSPPRPKVHYESKESFITFATRGEWPQEFEDIYLFFPTTKIMYYLYRIEAGEAGLITYFEDTWVLSQLVSSVTTYPRLLMWFLGVFSRVLYSEDHLDILKECPSLMELRSGLLYEREFLIGTHTPTIRKLIHLLTNDFSWCCGYSHLGLVLSMDEATENTRTLSNTALRLEK